MRASLGIAAIGFSCLGYAACQAGVGQDWVNSLPEEPDRHTHDGWSPEQPTRSPAAAHDESADSPFTTPPPAGTDAPDKPAGPPEQLSVSSTRAARTQAASNTYRNTYYDFPRDRGGAANAILYDPSCAVIAKVSKEFHDQVCVQGSGRLSSGVTVSFAKRDCACAAICPRTSQKICFEALDPARFPHGRGATGRAITPLLTVAVDSDVIPLGTVLFIPEFAGIPRPDGSPHDGCFIAEDRGTKVVGKHVDIFTGDPTVTKRWNKLMPSNQGVRVHQGDARCAALRNRTIP